MDIVVYRGVLRCRGNATLVDQVASRVNWRRLIGIDFTERL